MGLPAKGDHRRGDTRKVVRSQDDLFECAGAGEAGEWVLGGDAGEAVD